MDGTGIRHNVTEEIRNLARKYNITQVILFGSRARGDFKRTSDIVNLDREMQPELLDSIKKEGRVLYEKV